MEQFVQEIISLAFQAALAVVAGFVVLILKRVAEKYGLHIDAVREAQLKSRVRDILVTVEEQYEAKAKVAAGAYINKSAAKLNAATTKVIDAVPGISKEEAEALVKQELPKIGLGAAAFGREVLKNATN